MIVLSAGIQKSSTAWYFNLTNDLLVAAGHADARQICQKYHLQSVLLYRNCLLKAGSLKRFLLLIPHWSGETFAVKLHGKPGGFTRFLLATRTARATFLYRDPRDVALSLYEYSQKLRQKGKNHRPLAKTERIEDAILEVASLLGDWQAWASRRDILMTRYEDLVNNPVRELERLQNYLGLALPASSLERVVEKNRADSIARSKGHFHFNAGRIGRHRAIFTAEQHALCRAHFGEILEQMNYRWEHFDPDHR